jgi:hypothetical protein
MPDDWSFWGRVDEVRIAGRALAANWLAAEAANQRNPGQFARVGPWQ